MAASKPPKPPKPQSAETRYRAAYEAGIRRAAPGVTFCLVGKIGAVLGPVLRAHALDATGAPLTGDPLVAWIEAEAFAFRAATDDKPQFWGGWSPHFFARWLNERGGRPAPSPMPRLQPMSGFRWPKA